MSIKTDSRFSKRITRFEPAKKRTVIILLNGNLNHHFDIQSLLTNFKPKLARSSRVVIIVYNSYLKWLYSLASFLGFRPREQPSTFLTHTDLNNLVKLSGFEIVRTRHVAFCPFNLLGIGSLLNKILPAIPFLNQLGIGMITVLRPIVPTEHKPSLSVIILARNEWGTLKEPFMDYQNFKKLIWKLFL